MSTNNGTSLNHSPTLTPAQGKSPTNPLVKPEVRQSESVRTRQFEQPAPSTISYLVTGNSGC